jgi:hypothetical protein
MGARWWLAQTILLLTVSHSAAQECRVEGIVAWQQCIEARLTTLGSNFATALKSKDDEIDELRRINLALAERIAKLEGAITGRIANGAAVEIQSATRPGQCLTWRDNNSFPVTISCGGGEQRWTLSPR